MKEQGCDTNLYVATYGYSKDISPNFKEFLKRYDDNNFNVENELRLYVGSQVMVTANFSDLKLYNGNRGVIGFNEDNKLPIVKFLDKKKLKLNIMNGNTKVIRKILLQNKSKIAWAITIHKCRYVT